MRLLRAPKQKKKNWRWSFTVRNRRNVCRVVRQRSPHFFSTLACFGHFTSRMKIEKFFPLQMTCKCFIIENIYYSPFIFLWLCTRLDSGTPCKKYKTVSFSISWSTSSFDTRTNVFVPKSDVHAHKKHIIDGLFVCRMTDSSRIFDRRFFCMRNHYFAMTHTENNINSVRWSLAERVGKSLLLSKHCSASKPCRCSIISLFSFSVRWQWTMYTNDCKWTINSMCFNCCRSSAIVSTISASAELEIMECKTIVRMSWNETWTKINSIWKLQCYSSAMLSFVVCRASIFKLLIIQCDLLFWIDSKPISLRKICLSLLLRFLLSKSFSFRFRCCVEGTCRISSFFIWLSRIEMPEKFNENVIVSDWVAVERAKRKCSQTAIRLVEYFIQFVCFSRHQLLHALE